MTTEGLNGLSLHIFQELFQLFGCRYVGQFEFDRIIDARNVGEHDVGLVSSSHHLISNRV